MKSNNLYEVVKYSKNEYSLWNDFISKSKNATFLFHRDFMGYHQDRFEDFSLLVFKDEKLVALLPANKVGNQIHSHQGLTYGGLLLLRNAKMNQVVKILDVLISYIQQKSFKEFHIKMIPEIYCDKASNEVAYLLYRKGADLYRRDIEMVIDFSTKIDIHKTKLKHHKKSDKFGFNIKSANEFGNFWKHVLEPKLEQKYNSKPVHSLEEIQLLKSKFANNIHQFDVYFEDEIVAGITIFETETTVKSQYGGATPKGENLRALEFLFIHLINKYNNEGKKYFSMGTANDLNTLGFNEGMVKQKEELGCSVFQQDFYRLKLK